MNFDRFMRVLTELIFFIAGLLAFYLTMWFMVEDITSTLMLYHIASIAVALVAGYSWRSIEAKEKKKELTPMQTELLRLSPEQQRAALKYIADNGRNTPEGK